ncbi:carbonic anhydrase [bacterium]|nr:carbonic anhydrase [bacterium]
MKRHEQLLLENKAWAADRVEKNPEFFKSLAKTQTPDFLWIGCSDSRVSPDEITQAEPGNIFVHRNVANLVVPTDINLLSIVQYAVEVLKVKHIIICGHHGCGGVKAAMGDESFGLIDEWLRHIKEVHRQHRQEIDALPTEEARLIRLIEHNVRAQLINLARSGIIQRAWKEHKQPLLHGWVYSMQDGIIQPILELSRDTPLDAPLPSASRRAA